MRLFILIVFVSLLSCGDRTETETSETCNEAVEITDKFPIAIKYAEIDVNQTCTTPVIGDIKASLFKKAHELCKSENCEEGECKAENTTSWELKRQHGTYSRIVGNKKECWVVIEVIYSSKCKCE